MSSQKGGPDGAALPGSGSAFPAQDHAGMVEDAITKITISGKARIVLVFDMGTGYLVTA